MKKRKGMTLMEIIVSMAVYAMLALLAVQIMSSMNILMHATNELNDRLTYEGKYADNNQTKVSNGLGGYNTLTPSNVTYEVRYVDNTSGVPQTKNVLNTKSSPPSNTFSANEYQITYPKTQDYVSDVNYRFISFTKTPKPPTTCPDGPFEITLRVVPFFSADYYDNKYTLEEQKAKINSAKAELNKIGDLNISIDATSAFDGVSGNSLPAKSVKTIGLGGETQIDVVNKAKTVDPDVYNVYSTLMLKATKESYGEQRSWADGIVDIYMYVKASESADSVSYYKSCLIEFDINTGYFKPYESLGDSDTYSIENKMQKPDYAAILTS